MAKRRFESWHSANRYPWESYEESKKRYERQYGTIEDEEVDTSWAEQYKATQPSVEPIEEQDSYLPDMGEFASGAAKSWDELQADTATFAEHWVAPKLDQLGSLREGTQNAELWAKKIRKWAPEYREEQLAEAAQYPDVKTRKQKRLEADPTYKPAETREETLERLRIEGGWRYELAKRLPEFVPLSTEKFAEDFPTAGETGQFASGTAVPMVAGGAAALAAYASGVGPIATAGFAMLGGGVTASAQVAAQTAEDIKNNPVARRALGIDPNIELSMDLIYGLPGDNFYTFRETVDFALSLSPLKLNLSPLVLLPGSTFWKEREKHQFVYEEEPPFLVHSNRTYTPEDFRKTRKLVLGVIMIMYFPAILDIVYKMTEHNIDEVIERVAANNNFNKDYQINKTKEYSSLTRLDLIELFMEKFEKKSNLLLDVDERSGKEEYSIKEYDYIRKSTMDDVAKAENGLHAYESMHEILKETERTDLMEEIQLGIDYYQLRCLEESVDSYSQKYGNERLKRIQFNWVVSSEIEHEYEAHEVPKTKSGGVGAMC